ncbi:MAG: metalloregulator ArsR/SmtB family transcription factor [Acidimicrobiia bacterium]
MEAFEVLGEPVRRRMLEHLATGGELAAGGLVALVQDEFPISQPAVSQHLGALRRAGLVTVRPDGTRRLYALRAEPLAQAERWLADLQSFWSQRLDALETELARGRRSAARTQGQDTPDDAAPAAERPRRMA